MSYNYPLLPQITRSETQYPPNSIEGYAHLLGKVLLDGIVSEGEKRLIEEHREQNGITDETHKMTLEHMGWTIENWDAAIEMGKETLPDEIYGRGSCKQVYYISQLHEKEKPIYCHGLIVAPHLRQWYTTSETGERDTFWREKEERKASPLELFFDLCFVATIYKLSHAMEDQSFSLLVYIILYCSFWRVWYGITSYSTRYEHEDWLHPLAYCTTMLGALFMTSEIHDTFALLTGQLSSPNKVQLVGFALSFIFASFPLFVLYFLATITELSGRAIFIHHPKKNLIRETTYHPLQMLIVLMISLIPWIITVAIEVHNPIPYWGSSLLFIEISTHIIDSYNHYYAPICVEHWGERFSLFVMIHLGESMFAIVSDYIGTFNSGVPLVAIMFGLIIPFSFRRVYFEIEGSEPKDPHALRHWLFLRLYTLSHLILCMAIIAYAIGFSGLQTVSNVEILGRDIQIPYYTQLDKRGELQPFQFNTEVIVEEGNTTVSNQTCATEDLTDLQLYYIFREDQWLFCGALAIMMLMVAIQTVLSKTEEKYEQKYFLKNRSQHWRIVLRLLLVIFLFALPGISYSTVTVTAFHTICVGGSFYFIWALLESFFVLKEVAHKHLLSHDPHYMEMSFFEEKSLERERKMSE